MKVIIDLMVTLKAEGSNDSFVFGSVRRELETNLIPIAGMDIEDSAWKNPREIKRVTMNPEEEYYSLWVGEDETPDRKQAYDQIQMYKFHGWQVLGSGNV